MSLSLEHFLQHENPNNKPESHDRMKSAYTLIFISKESWTNTRHFQSFLSSSHISFAYCIKYWWQFAS